jgi:thiol-disulfide isomerase/thioredoxin
MKKTIYLIALILLTVACNKNTEQSDYQACVNLEEQYKQLVAKYEQAEADSTLTPELETTLEQQADSLETEIKAAYARFFEKHINAPFAQQIFAETKWTRRLSLEQLEAIFNQVKDPVFQATDIYKQTAERVHNMKASLPGNPYLDFTSETPSGQMVALSEYVGKGKYVLLDFWASWCPPCRAEMPHLVELYQQYKDRNFEIVGYSLDQDSDAWTKGIEQLEMTWPQLSDCAYWNSPAAKLYAVQGIPCTVLIGPDGIIIERELDGEELAKKLAELIP